MNRSRTIADNFPIARKGCFSNGQAFKTSMNKAAKSPKWAPDGPDSARYGMKIADAILPRIPDPK